MVGCLPILIVKKMGWDSTEDFNRSKKAQVRDMKNSYGTKE